MKCPKCGHERFDYCKHYDRIYCEGCDFYIPFKKYQNEVVDKMLWDKIIMGEC